MSNQRANNLLGAAGVILVVAGIAWASDGGGPGGGEPGNMKTITCHANCGTNPAVTVNCAAGRAACCCPAGSPPVWTCACSAADGTCAASNCELTY